MSNIKMLTERKQALEQRLAKAKQQIVAMETELADVSKAIAADQENFVEARKQREQHWHDTDPAREDQ